MQKGKSWNADSWYGWGIGHKREDERAKKEINGNQIPDTTKA